METMVEKKFLTFLTFTHCPTEAVPKFLHMRSRKRNRSLSPLTLDEPAASPQRPLRAVLDRRNQADKLFEEARSAPDSEASQMLRAFLASGIRLAEAAPYQEGASEIEIGRERRRHLANRRLSDEFVVEGRRTKARARQLEKLLDDVADTVASAAEGKMDPGDVYNRISEILGFRSPMVPLVGPRADQVPQVPDGKDEPLNP